ncbi:MAG: methylated-DNA--[protein]-cysteine S-methyltransferase [Oscillospiraceae bacterium]|nr:methylated-DNA--[protein]-cysteine S-methyltransferase [Oscillospiraceae bacterium]
MISAYFYSTDVGEIAIIGDGKGITNVCLRGMVEFPPDCVLQETSLIAECAHQLYEYFAGARKKFALPLIFRGTDFQMLVWSALFTVPYAETMSYGQVARICKHPRAARAVGLACNKNPLLIVIPCHRIVGLDGRLSGYAAGVQLKEYLLGLEQKH